MIKPTPISVRALAYGGKFIGEAVNFAKIDIYEDTNKEPIASGYLPQSVNLNYAGQPSQFAANSKFEKPGTYEISIRAMEMNGNLGYAQPFKIICC